MTAPDHTPETAGPEIEALAIVEAERFLVIATATPEGSPWATPVYFAHEGLAAFWWVSRPSTRHSQLIAANPEVALTVFDSSRGIGEAGAVYAVARAEECTPEAAAREVGALSRRSETHGARPWDVGGVTGEAALRLYRARTSAVWLLPAGQQGPERRVEVPLGRPWSDRQRWA